MKGGNTKKLWENPEYREKMRLAHLGQKAWNKGKKTGLVPKTAFKKGDKSISGKNHKNWLGDKVNYRDLHKWVCRWKGQPDTCENCGKNELSNQQIHWANIDHKYRRVLDDFIRLCAKCHKEYDRKFK